MSGDLFDDAATATLDAIAAELALAERRRPIDSLRWRAPSDLEGLPTLHLEDVSAIPFLDDIAGVEQYQHRARVRAADGDLFAAVTPPTPGYEEYCRDLGLGTPELLAPEPVGHPLEVARACAAGETFARIAERANAAGGLVIHPYMAIEPVWELARRCAEEARVPVTVVGPPPAVTWIANDKVWFSRVVTAVLDARWLPEQIEVTCAEDAASALSELAGRHPRVGIKRARCASAMGNRVWSSADLERGDRELCADAAAKFAADTRWPADEGGVVVEWMTATASPSTQLWIPPLGHGAPRLDGVYEQILDGPEQVFVGSRPSRLGGELDRRIGDGAVRVAAALQYLGYSGRCSFDHLVVDDPDEPSGSRVVFTECNGRWGGTSTPMSLVDRLTGAVARGEPRPFYRAQDVVYPTLVGARFTDIVEALGSELYHPRRGGRFVLYNVGPLAQFGKLDVIGFGDSIDEVDAALLEDLPRRLGVS